MDSLLASYGSSDEDDEEQQQQREQKQKQPEETDYPSQPTSKFSGNSESSNGTAKTSSSIFSFLPPPKSSSSSLFSSLSPPKSNLPKPPHTLTNFSSPNSNNRDQEDEQLQQQEDSKFASKFGEQSSSAVNCSSKPSSLFSSLPEPKSSSIFSSLPPKTHQSDSQGLTNPAKSSSLFSSLPEPKSSSISSSLPPPKIHQSDKQALANPSSSSGPNPKKVVLFRPPINPSLMKSSDDDDDDDDDDEEKQRKGSKDFAQTSSVKSFLSSIPAPKNSVALGSLPSSVGSGRRSIIEADVPASNYVASKTENEVSVSVNSNIGSHEGQWVAGSASNSLGAVSDSSEYTDGGDASYLVSASENYVNYDGYSGYENYNNYGHYDSNWVDGPSTTAAPDVLGMAASMMRVPGKRGRNEVPQEIVEVKQDELIKNRPREDQAKLTGIAFGPSYQPASTKGKPSKLHKRKHQIGSLYFDVRQKEMELAERRSKGFLTKAETQAKYGW